MVWFEKKAYFSEISSPFYKATALGAMATLTGIITLTARVCNPKKDMMGSKTWARLRNLSGSYPFYT